ncbi:MAG: Single-stranded DNA-binding protein A [Chlamydiia bacterium]|nr:Single-stranded DNA-binding protein A [Chlamydiia bacterium]MCH9618090.1 Single-stranded DNA-binding protein A [Chlamydiia bacterium]
MNYTWIAGNLGADPETRFTPSGKKVTSLRVATKSRKNGADETMWMKVTIWGETFDKILPYFKKGSAIVVCGELMIPDIYQNRDGVTQVSMAITAHHISFSPFGKGKSSEGANQGAAAAGGFSAAPAQAFASNPPPSEIPDEGIPF